MILTVGGFDRFPAEGLKEGFPLIRMNLLAGDVLLKLIVRGLDGLADQKTPFAADFFDKVVAEIDLDH